MTKTIYIGLPLKEIKIILLALLYLQNYCNCVHTSSPDVMLPTQPPHTLYIVFPHLKTHSNNALLSNTESCSQFRWIFNVSNFWGGNVTAMNPSKFMWTIGSFDNKKLKPEQCSFLVNS